MASHTPMFPEPPHEETKKRARVRGSIDLKDPIWWAIAGGAFMVFALVFVLFVARS